MKISYREDNEMYCNHCGADIDDKAVICVYCGSQVMPAAGTGASPVGDAEKKQNNLATAAIICAVLAPVVGLILGLVAMSKSKTLNGAGKNLALAAVIVAAVRLALEIIYSITTLIPQIMQIMG